MRLRLRENLSTITCSGVESLTWGHVSKGFAMFKKTINLKVFELAIKKKDFTFLARHLVDHLRETGWTHADISAFVAKLENASRGAEPAD